MMGSSSQTYNGIEYEVMSSNCRVIDSYMTKDRATMRDFCEHLCTEHPVFKYRSIASYVREWRAHNLLYHFNYEIVRTKDCDLNVDESKWRRLAYIVLSFLYNFIKD